MNIDQISDSFIYFFYPWCSDIFWNKSPLSEYSIMILINSRYHKVQEVSVRKTSLYPIMLGCLMLARMRTSFNAFYRSLSVKSGNLTFFKAYLNYGITRGCPRYASPCKLTNTPLPPACLWSESPSKTLLLYK